MQTNCKLYTILYRFSCQFMTRSDDDGGKVSPSKGAAWLMRLQLMMSTTSSWFWKISFSSQLARGPHQYQPEADLERTQFALRRWLWRLVERIISNLRMWADSQLDSKLFWCSKINMNMNESIGKVFVGTDFFGGCTFILPIIDLNWYLWGTPWFINSLLKTRWSHLQMVFGYASDYQREGWGCIALLGTWEVVNLSWSVTLSSDNLRLYISAQKDEPFTEYVRGKTKISLLKPEVMGEMSPWWKPDFYRQ